MNEKFLLYLNKIGLLKESISTSLVKRGNKNKTNNNNFINSSFDLFMYYFNNLNDEQKKYMSNCIPANFITISEKIKKDKIKSIYVQIKLREKIILLKYFFIWKININIFQTKKDLDLGTIINSVQLYNLRNIDNNVDIDNIHITKTEENEQNNKINNINIKNKIKKSLSFIEDNNNKLKSEKEKYCNTQFNSKYNTSKNTNNFNISFKNRSIINDIKPYYFKNRKFKTNKINLNITSNNIKFINEYLKQIKNNKNKNNKNDLNKRAPLLTSLEEKEKIELEECFFKPKINKVKKFNRNNSLCESGKHSFLNKKQRQKEIQARFEKLYRDNEKYKITKELKIKENEKIVGAKNTFNPNINMNIKKIKKFKSEGNFEKRQEKYLLNKKKHSTEIRNQIDTLYDTICSFNPKITNDKGEYYKIKNTEKIRGPAFLRLYNDGKNRQKNQILKEIEKTNNILNLSNIINPGKTFDFSTINRLYENKEKMDIMSRTKLKVEKDEGVTFKPFIYDNCYSKSINGSFYERNQKFLNDKEFFYEEENKKKNEQNKKNISKKEYTKEERQNLINNIIKRLYNNSAQIRNNNKK